MKCVLAFLCITLFRKFFAPIAVFELHARTHTHAQGCKYLCILSIIIVSSTIFMAECNVIFYEQLFVVSHCTDWQSDVTTLMDVF